LELPGFLDALYAIRGFTADLKVCAAAQQRPDATANDFVIVDDQNANISHDSGFQRLKILNHEMRQPGIWAAEEVSRKCQF
jgi:hypothetical protein